MLVDARTPEAYHPLTRWNKRSQRPAWEACRSRTLECADLDRDQLPSQGKSDAPEWRVGAAIVVGLPLAVLVIALAFINPVALIVLPVGLGAVAFLVVTLIRGELPAWVRHPPRWW